MRLTGLLKEMRAVFAPRSRRSWSHEQRVHVEHRPVASRHLPELERAVRAGAQQLGYVERVDLNPYLRRVIFTVDRTAFTRDELERVVEDAERSLVAGDFEDAPAHPADEEAERQMRYQLGADAAAVALGGLLRVTPLRASSMGGNLVAAISIVRAVPQLRQRLEARVGRERAELLLNLGLAWAQAAAQRPLSSMVDAAHKAALLREIHARQRVWALREPDLCEHTPSPHEDLPPRPVEMPAGPVEEYGDRAVYVSLAGFAFSFLTTRSMQRATAALFGGVPRPARLGRDVFCAELGHVLASREMLVLDPDALRRLDRVDCLVVHQELATARRFSVGRRLIASDGIAHDEARERAERMFDPEHPVALQRADGWTLAPPALLDAPLDPAMQERSRALARRGSLVLALARDGHVAALVDVDVLPQTGVHELIEAAHRAQMHVVVATDDHSAVDDLEADDIIRGGASLAAGIRRLQRDGHGVCVLARGPTPGIAAADVAIGLHPRGQAPPWGAHILCNDDLADVRFLLEASLVARRISKQSTYIALGAATLGTVASAGGLLPLPTRRVLFVVSSASLLSMANGVRGSTRLRMLPITEPRDVTPWHALDTEGVLQRLGTTTQGLSERDVILRASPSLQSRSTLDELSEAIADEIFNPLAPILAAGAGLSAAVGSVADAGMVGAVVGLNALIGGTQRFRAERAIRSLFQAAHRHVLVRRDGKTRLIEAAELVPGDIVTLGPGDVIPADCRIVEAESLEVDASSLTGESLPVIKTSEPSFEPQIADRSSMLYEGTHVAAGRVTAVVVAVGEQTEARHAASAKTAAPRRGGVERRLRELMSLTGPVAAAAGIGAVTSGMLRGRRLPDLIESGVSLAIAAVPEGLPLLATAAQLAAAERLSRRGALVRNHRSVEALGQIDVLCLDKTGTLTEGSLALWAVSDGEREMPLDQLDSRREAVLSAALRATPDARLLGRSDPTDDALRRGAVRSALDVQRDRQGWRRVRELPFEAGRGFHSVLGRTDDHAWLSVKGAPEVVLPRCTRRADGTSLAEPERERLLAHAGTLAKRGLRVLAVAERGADVATSLDPETPEALTFEGLLVFSDPVRPSATSAIEWLAHAGVRTVMITGDHPMTAESIASDLGLLERGSVITGAELADLGDEALDARLNVARVFARVTPGQKVRIVRALQRHGHTVAMAGDGSNDAPAIRLADVGIAVGEHSTAAARGAADMVLADERIETLVHAIIEGRAMWSCVRDAVSILVGGNLGEIGFTLWGSLLDGRSPLNARQLLLVNLLTDVAPAMAIALRPPPRSMLQTLAQAGPDKALGKTLDQDILSRAVITAGSAGAAWAFARMTGSAERAGTVGLAALVGAQLGQTLVSGGPSLPVVATGVGSAALLGTLVQTPGVSHLFGCRPLGPIGWATALGASAVATGASVVLPRWVAQWSAAATGPQSAAQRRPVWVDAYEHRDPLPLGPLTSQG